MPLIRWIWIGFGYLCLFLALLGVVLPLLPTTPLVILAAFCFSKGSPRLHRWLHSNRLFGPLIVDWERHGVIRTKAKMMATIAIVLLYGFSMYITGMHISMKILLMVLGILILTYIWSRPSCAEKSELV